MEAKERFIPAPKHFIPRLGVVEIQCKSILTPTKGFLKEFTHTINPYTGCWFNCSYCYVPSGFELKHGTWGKKHWGNWVQVKINAPRILEKTLKRWELTDNLEDKFIYLGSVTDPYQLPWERKYKLTRKLLKIFTKYPVGFINIQTRSPLIQRDLDLLIELNDVLSGNIAACMTIPTNDERIKRLFEPTTPSLSHRRNALKIIYEAGIESQASVSPLLPCDAEELASQLDPICNRVVVGCLIELEEHHEWQKTRIARCGPSTQQVVGAKTRDKFYDIARRNDLEWFFKPLEQTRIIHRLRKYLGRDRVLQGQYGFNISAKLRQYKNATRKTRQTASLTDFINEK